jgi:hypothetical protein
MCKGPQAEDDSDYASMVREMCKYCKHMHDGGLPRMMNSSFLLSQSLSFGIFFADVDEILYGKVLKFCLSATFYINTLVI